MSANFKGLSSREVETSRKEHGTNALVRIRGKSVLKRFLENLSDPIIKILVFALALEVIFTFGNCNLIEVFGILARHFFHFVNGDGKGMRQLVAKHFKGGFADKLGDKLLGLAGGRAVADGDILNAVFLNQS